MPSLLASLRRLRSTRRSARAADVRFCDGCVEIVDRGARAAALRRGHEAALTHFAVRL
ncbi:hypothetical protein HHL19_01370 [Streptomyces sp. R302]|uniref:hypothetical protein n=1 Tax=unclassified Streptomyces TaxID=2593676 RepID=UPI00145D1984|nr:MULTISPECIES: hypothetical protein [unclassified Streptomyces]NML49017.1 hypothetical protein [Streptomyces sp. R301]NML77344.1 hypothetical protein [Streptomyces sp. R302]